MRAQRLETPMLHHYRPSVLADLARHGVLPLPHTQPELVRDYVRELYKYEIKRLRAQRSSNFVWVKKITQMLR